MTNKKLNHSKKPRSKVREFLDNFGVSAVVAMIVSGLITTYFDCRIKNSEERVTSLVYSEQQFDNAHNNVLAQLAVFNNDLFNHATSDPDKRDELLKAITTTQLQLLNFRNKLNASDQAVADNYAHQLEDLAVKLRGVSRQSDLKSVFVSAQQLLALHDKLADQAKEHLDISAF